jgi:hypothetical protein
MVKQEPPQHERWRDVLTCFQTWRFLPRSRPRELDMAVLIALFREMRRKLGQWAFLDGLDQ